MVSAALIKLSSPVARSCLVAISTALLVDAALTIYSAVEYPYLLDHYHDYLYIMNSQTIAYVYSSISVVAILLSLSTAFACYYKDATNYLLIHTGLNSIFLPVSILVYFSTASSRYKPDEFAENYRRMMVDYGISRNVKMNSALAKTKLNNLKYQQEEETINAPEVSKLLFESFINSIDSIQVKFSCCGLDSAQDWINMWNGYIAPTCCEKQTTQTNSTWALLFNVPNTYEFEHCTENDSHHLGCLLASKEDENSKYTWLCNLIIFMIIITIANTIVSMLLFGLSKTEGDHFEGNEHELSIVGVSTKPRLSQPTITSIKARPSVVQTLGLSPEAISSRAQAVRFNLSQAPRGSISGPSKFSAAARRGSSVI